MRRRLSHAQTHWYMDDWTRSRCAALASELKEPDLCDARKNVMRRQYLLLRYRILLYHQLRPPYFVLLDDLPLLLFAKPTDCVADHLEHLRRVHHLGESAAFDGIARDDKLTFEEAGIPLGATLRLV